MDITVDEKYQKLVARGSKSVNRKGTLSKRWNYAFHGDECNFYNKKHQQTVEVVLYNPPDFGYIDPWFLMIYMQSTKKYKGAVGDIDLKDLLPIIASLYKSGKISRVA